MALVALSVVEQRLDAVRAVLAGASVSEVAAGIGTSRQTIHTWLSRYLSEGLPGLADRSHRPRSSPQQVDAAVEVRVAELRRGASAVGRDADPAGDAEGRIDRVGGSDGDGRR